MKYEAIVETGEIVVREMTEEELAQDAKDRAKFAKLELEKQEEQAKRETAKASAEAKLEALGLTTEDLKALGL
jgi:hypothetical protein